MAKKRKRKSYRGALIKGMSGNLPSDILEDPVFKKTLMALLKGYAGIYALYKDDKLYYVGLAKSLHGRLGQHQNDRHAEKWNYFKVFRIQKVRYLKDLETLILNIAQPKGNRMLGKVPKDADLNRELKIILKDYLKKIRPLKKALH